MPRGVDYRIPLAELLAAAEDHRRGWSLRAISRMRYRRWGYASPGSALEGLRKALRTIEAPVRDRVEATVDASLVHGHARRAMRMPEHPEHARALAHRAYLRAQKREGAL